MSGFHVLITNDDIRHFESGLARPDAIINHIDSYTLLFYKNNDNYLRLKGICQQLWAEKKTAICLKTGTIRSAFFDMDSTVIGQECIVELASFAGSSDEVAKITEDAMQGLCSFDEALRARVATLKGQSIDIIESVSHRLSLNPGIDDLSKILTQKQCSMHLISGGFIELASCIAKSLSFQSVHANTLEKANGKLTGQVIDPIVGAQAKRNYLLEKCQENTISSAECMAVGDGANDLLMLKEAGYAIGYNPKPVLFDTIDGAIFEGFNALSILLKNRDQV